MQVSEPVIKPVILPFLLTENIVAPFLDCQQILCNDQLNLVLLCEKTFSKVIVALTGKHGKNFLPSTEKQ